MRVDLARDMGARVVEALGDDLDVDALGESQRCPGVTQTVEYEAGERSVGMGPVVLHLLP